jgi:hypothetical protein
MSDEIPWYDNAAAMRKRIETDGLSGVRAIAIARGEAGYKRKERLQQWLILGRWFADTCGNFGTALPLAPADVFPGKANDFMVLAAERIASVFGEGIFRGYSIEWGLPADHERCDRCGLGWDLRNATDLAYRSGREDPPRHRECQRLAVFERSLASWDALLERTGIVVRSRRLIPNRYWGSGEREFIPQPWCIVETLRGPIVMGWRKRVIHVQWDELDAKVPGSAIVSRPDVTHGETMVHCYGDDDFVRALSLFGDLAELRAPTAPKCGQTCEHEEHCYGYMHSYEHPCCNCGAEAVPVPEGVCPICYLAFDEGDHTGCEAESKVIP